LVGTTTFDYSSLVVLELLARQEERLGRGERLATRIESVFIANGGLFADAHSHPWQTTPLLKTPFGALSMRRVQRSPRSLQEHHTRRPNVCS
jgi:hypothetical protein